jgi:hypothetical protein
MAHFAELDENNVVLRVVVVADEEATDVNGVESEELGIAFCRRLYGVNTRWKQTSYNGNIRKRYAGIGHVYNETLDAFMPSKPYDSWVLNTEKALWEAPIPKPELTEEESQANSWYAWDEPSQTWTLNVLNA